ncbi:MAG: ATP-binding cassette domain-containing protein [Candidatus Aminicenantes bacterium]|nr:ATP-binding cassette domain-containing protein [Candidatus Aminicenantes bacterium]NTV80575.1 ATP-binding cassette domain-containing protein [Candidatus Aminicenantes bacterium]
MDIITARDLTVGYGRTEVLRGLAFAVPEGLITAVVGVSGSGKSTLLKTLAGLLPPLGGGFEFAGSPVDYRSEASLGRLYAKIGVLYQDGALLNGLSLYENVALPVRMHYPELPEAVVRDMVHAGLAQVEMAGSAEKFPSELSGGMRKRGALARALVLDPQVVFCDEPSSGLDPITSRLLDDLLLRLKESFKMTLVVVTHELRSIERVADRVLLLNDGGLRYSGEYGDLAASDDGFIRTFFLRKGHHDDT